LKTTKQIAGLRVVMQYGSCVSKEEDAPRASFTSMVDSTPSDWKIIGAEFVRFAGGLPDRVLKHLSLLDGDYGGFPIDRLSHSLQTATLAHADGRDEEYVVCALLHDIGDTLGSYNHPDIGAAILKPFVSEENHWMVEKHGMFQGYYFFHHLGMNRDVRESLRGHPSFAYTEEFCARYDAPAFDPAVENRPLAFFEPMVRRVLARPKRSLYSNVSAEPR
jgi:predicted HD phosphohydrolase